MKTSDEKHRAWLLRRYYNLCRRFDLEECERKEILQAYKVENSVDLDKNQLIEICEILERLINPKMPETEAMRRKVIASIGGLLKTLNVEENINMIKVMACNKAGHISFDEIPICKLRKIDREYRDQQKLISIKKLDN